MTTPLVLDALEHAIFTRANEGVSDLSGLVSHSDAGSQYVSIALTERLLEAGIDASVGSVGDAYDNSLAETTIGSFKTEMINRNAVSYTHLRAHETVLDLVCRLLLEKNNTQQSQTHYQLVKSVSQTNTSKT